MSILDLRKFNKELLKIHAGIAGVIDARLREFRSIWERGSDRELFLELVFCLLTPQSGARRCGHALENLVRKGHVFNGRFNDICRELAIVRFRNNKTGYILEARAKFYGRGRTSLKNVLRGHAGVMEMRDWLYRNVKGFGYKEASHYLRNIGQGEDIAILDRHVLRNMLQIGLIDRLPASFSYRRYRDLETLLRDYSLSIDIPLNHLDFVLWYKETRDIFK
jgi:N-glycosylase/DNA lyase